MDVSIIIVSYNTKKLTAQTIQSIFDSKMHSSFEVIVVDNDSRDGSPEYLHNIFGSKIKIRKQKENGGFAKANNAGIEIAKGKIILLLNSDTIIQNGAIDAMVRALETHPSYGIVSCRLLNPDGSYQAQGGALPTLSNLAAWWLWPLPGALPGIEPYQNMREIYHAVQDDVVHEVGWVGGTVMMIRREVLDTIGVLDEKIFMYAEDVDFCIRAQRKQYKVGIISSGEITHIGSASSDSSRAKIGEIRGLLYLFSKYWPSRRGLLKIIFFKGALLRLCLFGILYRDSRARALYSTILQISITA